MWRTRVVVIVVLVSVTALVFVLLNSTQTPVKGILDSPLVAFLFAQFCGLATSFLSWWVLVHGVVPKAYFSPNLSKVARRNTTDNASGYDYRVKIGNFGRRSIIDVEISARLRITGLEPRPQATWIVKIPIEHEMYFRIPEILPHKKGEIRNKVLTLDVNEANDLFASDKCPERIKAKAILKTLTLEDLLSIGTTATLTIYVAGFDEFSGARKQFVSHPYSFKNVKLGRFGDDFYHSFEVIEEKV
jgi:hypothetical protein